MPASGCVRETSAIALQRPVLTSPAGHASAVDGGQAPATDPEPCAEARRRHLESTGNASPALPFGVTLLGPAWSDEFLWDVAAAFHVRLWRPQHRCPSHRDSTKYVLMKAAFLTPGTVAFALT